MGESCYEPYKLLPGWSTLSEIYFPRARRLPTRGSFQTLLARFCVHFWQVFRNIAP